MDLPSFELSEPEAPVSVAGYIEGRKATNIEMNLYQAALEYPETEWIVFQPNYGGQRYLPGAFRPDFLFSVASIVYPTFADGEYWHKDQEKGERDRQQLNKLNEILSGTGAYPAQRIPGSDLENVDEAREAYVKLLGGFYIGFYV